MRILLALLLVSNVALANEAAILRCRGIAEVTPRLACYDAMELAAKVVVAPSKPVAVVPQPAPAVVAKTEVEKFGLVDKGWEATTAFRLANGQVWRVSDDSARPHYVDNPKIQITRGAFGAFYMKIRGTKIAPRVNLV